MGRVRLTSKIAALKQTKKEKTDRKVNDSGRSLDGFEYDTSKAKILKNALHNLNVALGTMIGAIKDLAMLRGSDITPDGKLGGRGFVMEFREVKTNLTQMISNLSDITDTIGDELTNPKWGLKSKEVKEIKEDKKDLEEKVEDVEEKIPSGSLTEQSPQEEGGLQPPIDQVSLEDLPPLESPEMSGVDLSRESSKEISPKDVKDSYTVEARKKYEKLFDRSSSLDNVGNILKKEILANLLK